jgi:hypothetical protein
MVGTELTNGHTFFRKFPCLLVVCSPFQQGKDIVFRFIIDFSSLMDFGPYVIDLFLYEDFLKRM